MDFGESRSSNLSGMVRQKVKNKALAGCMGGARFRNCLKQMEGSGFSAFAGMTVLSLKLPSADEVEKWPSPIWTYRHTGGQKLAKLG